MRFSFLFVALAASLLSFSSTSQAAKVEAGLEYPVMIGLGGQNFTSNTGFNAAFYLDPILNPSIQNYISIGYDSFTIRADQTSSFKVVPVLIGLEATGKVFEDLKTTFGLGAGASFAYLSVPNAASYKAYGYFTAQVKPGIEYDIASSSLSVVLRTPINFLMGSKQMSFIAYNLGIQFQFGGDTKTDAKAGDTKNDKL